MRVEGPVIEKLKEDYEFEVLGVDMLADELEEGGIKIHPELEGRLKTGRLESLAQDLESEGKFDVVVMWGSVRLNMNLLVEQMRYMRALGEVLNDGGVVLDEMGVPEVVWRENARYQRMKEEVGRAEIGVGDIEVNPEYRGFEGDNEVGARFFRLDVWSAMLQALGYRVNISSEDLARWARGEEVDGVLVRKVGDGNYRMVMRIERASDEKFHPLQQVLEESVV